MDAFDADVLIYAGAPEHSLGARVRAQFPAGAGGVAGVGSVLLLPEVLAKRCATKHRTRSARSSGC